MEVRRGRPDLALEGVAPLLTRRPFPLLLRHMVIDAVGEIETIERDRGPMKRRDRSKLSPTGQPFQDFIDRLLFRMAGLSDAETVGVERRLASWL